MRIEELLNTHYERFTESEKYVCHYLSNHYEECTRKTVEAFASECNVSKALLVRFAKKIGLSGYSELKARIKIELQERDGSVEGLLQTMTDSYHKMMDDFMHKDLSGLFRKLHSAERVFVYGSGSSQARAASEMKRIFLPVKGVMNLHGHDLIYALQKNASPNDLVIIISLSGESDMVVELAKSMLAKRVPTVSITGLRSNTLASLCEENLYINSVRLPVKYNIEYEFTTPYFILTEYLYLAYQDFLMNLQQ